MSIYTEDVVIEAYNDMLTSNNKSTIKMVKRILKNIKHPNYYRILDIGCGLSPLLQPIRNILEPCKIKYVGIDNSYKMLENAKKINKSNETTSINYLQLPIQPICNLREFPWYNIVLVQSFIHLLLDKDEVTNLCKFISKILPSDGVFYISTKITPDKLEHLYDDIYIVKKIDDIEYPRRLFTTESFKEMIISVFVEEGTYDIDFFEEYDDLGNLFLNVIGRKDPLKLYQKYHYHIGFDERLMGISEILSHSTNYIEYVDNPIDMITIRKEALMIDLFNSRRDLFIDVMKIMGDIFKIIFPEKYPVYMKDKLNINRTLKRFKLHQDASAGWSLGKFENIVTIGILISDVTNNCQGATRIAIRQGYMSHIIETETDHTIDESKINEKIGKPLQYLNCFGIAGNFYVFDQFVLHDSKYNLSEIPRNVWFLTLGVSDDPTDMFSIETGQSFYDKKSSQVLDKKKILQYLKEGKTYQDFIIDVFGKIKLSNSCGECDYIVLD
jgi:SAM-dependent methyltransferase